MRKSPVNRDMLRYFAIICMTLDHIAWFFMPFLTPAAQVMHFFGRMTAPIMCFFVAEGYHYTKNLNKYFLRLGAFALISQLPFYLLGDKELNMIFTLLFSLAAVAVLEKRGWHPAVRALVIAVLIAACHYADWDVFAILWVLGFHVFRENRAKKAAVFVTVWLGYFFYAVYINVTRYNITGPVNNALYSLYTFGSLAALLLVLFLYNGEKGRFRASKWIIYAYYPVHLMVIWLVSKII